MDGAVLARTAALSLPGSGVGGGEREAGRTGRRLGVPGLPGASAAAGLWPEPALRRGGLWPTCWSCGPAREDSYNYIHRRVPGTRGVSQSRSAGCGRGGGREARSAARGPGQLSSQGELLGRGGGGARAAWGPSRPSPSALRTSTCAARGVFARPQKVPVGVRRQRRLRSGLRAEPAPPRAQTRPAA